jgi:hypothetical protein
MPAWTWGDLLDQGDVVREPERTPRPSSRNATASPTTIASIWRRSL